MYIHIQKKEKELPMNLKPQISPIYTLTHTHKSVSETQNHSNANTHTHTPTKNINISNIKNGGSRPK